MNLINVRIGQTWSYITTKKKYQINPWEVIYFNNLVLVESFE